MDRQIQEKGSLSLNSLGLKHGDMIYVDAVSAISSASGPVAVVSETAPKAIDAHGNLVASEKPKDDAAFRPGLQSLRSQKLHWTMTDFVEYDNKYTFEIKGEQLSFCSSASLDAGTCNSFQSYLHNYGFNTYRCGYLYGTFVRADLIEGSVEYNESKANPETKVADDSKPKKYGQTKRNMKLSDLDMKKEVAPRTGVVVHSIYEPLQQFTGDFIQLLEDPKEEIVEKIASDLGLQKVGVIFSHPPGREGYHFSAQEILFAGDQALEATQGKLDSSFVVVKVTSDQGNASFDAFSLTPQCLEMVAEEALVPIPATPGACGINPVFTLIVEKKETHVVDNDFFIKRVPIISHDGPLASSFPCFNRELTEPPSPAALKKVLETAGRNASDAMLATSLADFHLLIYIADIFDSSDGGDLEQIVKFVASHVLNKNEEKHPVMRLEEGYKLMLLTVAGLE